MKKIFPVFIFLSALLVNISCKQKERTLPKAELNLDLRGTINRFSKTTFDSALVSQFFITYPELAKYEDEINVIYRGYRFHHIWFDENGVLEFANSLSLSLKYRNGEKKYALRKILSKYVPEEMTDRPKHGFGAPVMGWLAHDLAPLADKYLSKQYL